MPDLPFHSEGIFLKLSSANQIQVFVFIKILGPHLMNKREAFNVKKAQLLFNTFHLLINAYIFVEVGRLAWFTGYSYRCQPVDFSNHGNPLKVR